MTVDEIKRAVLNLSLEDQRRFVIEVLPEIWPKACLDDNCLSKVRELVDEAAVKEYKEQHMDTI